VAEAVARLLDDRSLRDAAGRVAIEIAAMPSPEHVAGLLAQRFGP
jgi:UDP:flavonoid glycosyltransferase YjiC (YdhE family)